MQTHNHQISSTHALPTHTQPGTLCEETPKVNMCLQQSAHTPAILGQYHKRRNSKGQHVPTEICSYTCSSPSVPRQKKLQTSTCADRNLFIHLQISVSTMRELWFARYVLKLHLSFEFKYLHTRFHPQYPCSTQHTNAAIFNLKICSKYSGSNGSASRFA